MPTTETKKIVNPTTYYGSKSQDKAINNIWKTSDDASIFHLVGNKPTKMDKKAGNVLINRATKLEGEIVYFLPKDKDGKLTGSPQRYLRLLKDGASTSDYVLADKVVPNVIEGGQMLASNFTALDDITNQMQTHGADGEIDVDIDGLDDSILNAIGKDIRGFNYPYRNANGDYSNLTNESLIEKYGTITNRSLLNKYSNLVNESLLDGLTENTSLLNADGNGQKVAFYVSLQDTGNYVTKDGVNYFQKGIVKEGTIKKVIEIKNVRIFDPKNNENLVRKMLIFNDGGAGLTKNWKSVKSDVVGSSYKVTPYISLQDTGNYVTKDGITYFQKGIVKEGTTKKVIEIKNVSIFDPKTNENLVRKMLIFNDGGAGLTKNWKEVKSGVDGDYSNLINESLLDGLTENTSLLNANGEGQSNLINESLLDGLTENTSLLNANGEGEFSNTVGDWFKGLFGGKDKGEATKKIADPNVAVVSAKTMEEAHKESGSSKPFRDWISSEGGRGVIDSITQLANVFVNQQYAGVPNAQGGYPQGYPQGYGGADKTPPSETKILGMSPITFGIVAIAVIAVGSIVTVRLLKAKKG